MVSSFVKSSFDVRFVIPYFHETIDYYCSHNAALKNVLYIRNLLDSKYFQSLYASNFFIKIGVSTGHREQAICQKLTRKRKALNPYESASREEKTT